MTKEAIPPARVAELTEMSRGLYGTIIGLTVDPFEAVTLLSMIHLTLWLNCREPGFTTEMMLQDYCKNFALNCEANDAEARKELN